jgi:hypothetical protein
MNDFKLDFIGIGAAKSGTTWLSSCLRAHPEICLSEPKEVQYFNFYHTHSDHQINQNRSRPFSWYVKHFQHCGDKKIKGEFSPIYLYDEKAPYLIKEKFPQIKLIACLRNPIDRVYSDYWMRRNYHRKENKIFEDAIKEGNYLSKGFYYLQLKKYFEIFNREQILILFFEDMVKNPDQEVRKVFKFLEVDPNFQVPVKMLFKKGNAAKDVRLNFLIKTANVFQRILINLRLAFIWIFLRNIGVKKLIMKFAVRYYKYPDMSSEMRKHLYEIYRDDIEKLGETLNRDLSHWR